MSQDPGNTQMPSIAPANPLDGGGVPLGEMSELLDELGLEPEGGAAAPAAKETETPAATGDGTPERDEQGRFVAKPKDGDGDAAGKDKTEEAPEDDAEIIRAINARSAARRRARRAAEAERAPAAVPASAPAAAPAPATPPAAKPETAAAEGPKPSAETVSAVRDVLLQIDALYKEDAADDAAAAPANAAEKAARDARADAREKQRTALMGKIDEISKGLASTDKLKEQLEAVQKRLEHRENADKVRDWVDRSIDAIEAEVPHVASGQRFEVVINGKKVRKTGPELVLAAAERHFDRTGKMPDGRELARRIEKQLAPAGAENAERTPTRKTLSSNALSGPPAARKGPDDRKSSDVSADLDAWIDAQG